ncbi:hypothetical protein FACS18949_15710 [Clostridia bacterium]|nr:hypothetical protein FACS18949_15710 [Clostridia bacterium]
MSTEITTGYLALANTDFSAMMSEELDGLDLSFERVKIPSGGSIVFEVPGEDDAESVKEFSAVILHHHPLFAHYATKYTGGNNPPDCGSFDGVTGVGDPGGNCKACPLNQFGTGENGSKACKNRRRIYVLREGEIFPLLLSLPTGSLKEFTKYIKTLLSKGRKTNAVVTRFSLKKATNSGGLAYSQAQFTIDRVLSAEEYAAIEKMSEQIKAYSHSVGFEVEDVAVDAETGEVITPLNGSGNV